MWNISSFKASDSFYLPLDLLRNSIYYAPNTFTTVGREPTQHFLGDQEPEAKPRENPNTITGEGEGKKEKKKSSNKMTPDDTLLYS